MKTIPLSNVLYRYLQLSGQDKSNITTEDFALFIDFCNSRMDMVWGWFEWPELIRYQELAVVANPDGTNTITVPDDVDDVMEVWSKDPRTTTVNYQLQWFLVDSDTTRYINLVQAPATAWVVYKKSRTALSCVPYSAAVAYEIGAQIWFNEGSADGAFTQAAGKAAGGNAYTCIAATTAGQTPLTHASKWSKVEIPAFMGEYLARGTVADYLKGEGLYAQANAVEADAEAVRQLEVDRVVRIQGQVNRLNVYTY